MKPVTITVDTYNELKKAFASPEAGRGRAVVRALRDGGLLGNPAEECRRAWFKGRTPVVIENGIGQDYKVNVSFADGTVFHVSVDALTLAEPPIKIPDKK